MNTYLVVLDRDASAHGLRFGLLNFVSLNKPAELVLLRIAAHAPGVTAREARLTALTDMLSLRSQLRLGGLPIAGALVGDPLPRKAIAEEMASGRHEYAGILLTTRCGGFSRFLHFDLAHQLSRKFRVPVGHVEQEIDARVLV